MKFATSLQMQLWLIYKIFMILMHFVFLLRVINDAKNCEFTVSDAERFSLSKGFNWICKKY